MLSSVLARFRRVRGAPRPPTTEPAWADPSRLRLIVGLGNPEPRFEGTRHNVGFTCVRLVADRTGAPPWRDDRSRTRSLLTHVDSGDLTLIIAQPQTYMNASGEAAAALLRTFRVESTRVLIVFDDMDLPLGSLRLRERGSAGTHNGMRSIVKHLGHENVPRLRIGIGQAASREARDYVLSPFDPDQADAVAALVERAAEAVLAWAHEGAVIAMNRYNR